jgi:hypothetical protein
MAALVLTDCALWIGEFSFQGVTRSLGLALEQDLPECTVFGNTSRAYTPGLKGIGLDAAGNWDAPTDLGIVGTLLGANKPVTVSPLTTVGTFCYLFNAIAAEYAIGGAVGEVFPFRVRARGAGLPVRGMLMENSTRSATGNGTGQQLGAIGATQKLYSALHVPSVSASDTLDVTIESDNNSGFTTPTTRATLAQITAAGSVWTEISGPITDDWWRYVFTLGGASISIAIAGSMGIY